jgi:hypothetical protein
MLLEPGVRPWFDWRREDQTSMLRIVPFLFALLFNVAAVNAFAQMHIWICDPSRDSR